MQVITKEGVRHMTPDEVAAFRREKNRVTAIAMAIAVPVVLALYFGSMYLF